VNRIPESWARIYAVVRAIPKGRVMTYGQVAAAAGLPRRARLVGYALHALPEHSRVPWQRVVNARGEISLRGGASEQRLRLQMEGVRFDASGRIDLERFGHVAPASRIAGSEPPPSEVPPLEARPAPKARSPRAARRNSPR